MCPWSISASKIGGDEKPSSGHVVAGLARRSLAHGKSRTTTRHMGVFNARTVLSRLVDGGDSDIARGAANVVRDAIGSPSRPAKVRGKKVEAGARSARATGPAKPSKKVAKRKGARTAAVKKTAARKVPRKAAAATTATKKGSGTKSVPKKRAEQAATPRKATRATRTRSAAGKEARRPAKAAGRS